MVSIMVWNDVIPVLVSEVATVMEDHIMVSIVMHNIVMAVTMLSECWSYGQETYAGSQAVQFLLERIHGRASVLESRGG